MNISSKTVYYWVIIIVGLATTLLTLNIIRSRNKYPSNTSIKNVLTLYINRFYNLYNPNKNIDRVKYIKSISKLDKQLSIKENITMYTYPFEIKFEEDSKKKFDLKFNQTHNILYLKNIDNLSKDEYNDSLFKNFFPNLLLVLIILLMQMRR